MKNKKGFTLIELMVVIVIIGILSALAIPKMLGVSAKAKASEAPSVIANYETLESAYVQETGALGLPAATGFMSGTSMWWTYGTGTAGTITAATGTNAVGDCAASTTILTSAWSAAGDSAVHTKAGAAGCQAYYPNF